MRAIVARLAIGVVMALAAASAIADDWGNLATISSTLGVNANRMCIGEGLRVSDIGCPTYAPYVTSGGLVGIGTSSPSAKLHVSGGGMLLDNNQLLGWKSSGGTNNYWQLYTDSAFNDFTILGNSGTARVTILDQNGNVGIGTSAPLATLQVSGSMTVSTSAQGRRASM